MQHLQRNRQLALNLSKRKKYFKTIPKSLPNSVAHNILTMITIIIVMMIMMLLVVVGWQLLTDKVGLKAEEGDGVRILLTLT